MACAVGKVCTCTQLNDSVQYIEHKRKTRRDKINTGCCWNKFSEFKSPESSDSEQRVDGGQGDPGGTRKTTGKREEACGRYRSSSVHADHFPLFLRQAWWYVFSYGLGRDRDQSCTVSTVHHVILSSHKFACQPITDFRSFPKPTAQTPCRSTLLLIFFLRHHLSGSPRQSGWSLTQYPVLFYSGTSGVPR